MKFDVSLDGVMFRILLVYYHPVCWDLAQTFIELGHSVVVAVNPTIKDNYGTGADIIARAEEKYKGKFKVIPLALGIFGIRSQGYNLVGCDGVFDGDEQVMDACKVTKTPLFNLQGYPNVADEPAQNILSLGWFTPTVQYHQKYPSEGHKKSIDWKTIAETGESEGKNICVFYPNFWELKKKTSVIYDVYLPNDGFVSLIQGYEKWNKWSFEAFKKVRKGQKVRNLEGLDHNEVLNHLQTSQGLIHLKWADQPGIALIEAMLFGKPVLTMQSFVLASMNQEVLINHYNSIVADSIDELVEHMQPEYDDFLVALGENAKKHANMLTDFGRQKHKLKRFIDRCVSG